MFSSIVKRVIKVTKLVANSVDLNKIKKQHPKLANYMCRNVSIMMAISSIHLLLINSKEAYTKKKNLWSGIKSNDRRLYYRLKFGTISGLTDLPGKLGSKLTIGGYRLAKKVYQFQ